MAAKYPPSFWNDCYPQHAEVQYGNFSPDRSVVAGNRNGRTEGGGLETRSVSLAV